MTDTVMFMGYNNLFLHSLAETKWMDNLFVVGCLSVLFILTWMFIKLIAFDNSSLPLPPVSPTNILANIKVLMCEDMRKIDTVIELFKVMGAKKENYTTGVTFRHTLSLFRTSIYTDDYKLAKILQSGKHEAEKCANLKVFNVIDRDTNSIISHQNKSVDRELARKAIAPAFSSSNLYYSWPILQSILKEQFDTLIILALSGEAFDIKPICSKIILSYLGKSALDVKVNFDGTEDDSSVDGYKWVDGKLFNALSYTIGLFPYHCMYHMKG